MNIQEMDLMNKIKESRYTNQRELAQATGISLGKVNASIRSLTEQGYLSPDMTLTQKAQELFERSRPRQAVILAAGAGMRMIPINTEVPKGLLEVYGEPLIERIIRQLQEVGIRDIRVIVGFLKERYEYLIDAYGVELVFNGHYGDRNNLYSLAQVSDSLENAYIVPCDIWCRQNPFRCDELYSWYMVTDRMDAESTVRINRKRELRAVETEEEGNRMIGIAYLCADVLEQVKVRIRSMLGSRLYYRVFWEEALMEKDRMLAYPREVSDEEVFEINTLEGLRELDENSNQLNSELLSIAAGVLQCEEKEITEIEALKKGMTNRSFRFRCRDRRYIMRIPGEGTDKMINRRQEYQVYRAIAEEGICDPIRYMDPANGYKITEFLEGARVCDPESHEDVAACMAYLRQMHDRGLEVEHSFDIFGQILQYESYWMGEPSIYRDYQQTKEKVFELKQYIDAQEKRRTLTHIDAVPDNFLFVGDRIYLIDWEYAGMQDPYVDIAMFAIYAMYGREQVEWLIDAYFQGDCPEQVRTRIYCYIAACGLLWSNWCEYKRICGVEFGEYSLRQYRYAKEYYKIAKERIDHE